MKPETIIEKSVIGALFLLAVVLSFALLFFLLGRLAEPTGNALPSDSFAVSSSNRIGNGAYWVYGHDLTAYYYAPISDHGIVSIPYEQARNCEGFDEFDVLSWRACGADVPQDCEFIQDAKFVFEDYSTKTKDQDRYRKNEAGEYDCKNVSVLE